MNPFSANFIVIQLFDDLFDFTLARNAAHVQYKRALTLHISFRRCVLAHSEWARDGNYRIRNRNREINESEIEIEIKNRNRNRNQKKRNQFLEIEIEIEIKKCEINFRKSKSKSIFGNQKSKIQIDVSEIKANFFEFEIDDASIN